MALLFYALSVSGAGNRREDIVAEMICSTCISINTSISLPCFNVIA